jgi:hypothetical protein
MLIAEGEVSLPVGGGEVGEMLFGVCVPDPGFEAPSDSSAMEPFLDFAPIRLFFCLNFSNQLVLLALRWLSGLPTLIEKNLSFSFMSESDIGNPCFWWFFAQFASARSMSGNFPLAFRTGDLLPSSW